MGARPGDYVRITFADTGSGMDEETQKKIFTPFFTTKEVGKGTGLGMAVVYGIVKNHRGYITCESKLNQGTMFRIYWPVAPKGEFELTKEKAVEDTIRGGDESILIVDDEEAILQIAKESLTDHGYSVLLAGSGEKALEIFKQKQRAIDLIIMDLGMPGIGGHKTMVELLKLNPRVKVIIASGYSADSQVKEALAAGAAGFVGKPYKLNDLLRKIRWVLDNSDQG
jgi:CheY-like chemotaxis protein